MRKVAVACIAAGVALGAIGVATSTRALPGGRVQILFTSRVDGAMAPCGCAAGQFGGMPRRANALERLRDPRASLLVDAGNFVGQRVSLTQLGFSDPYPYYHLHNLTLARGMAALNYDAVNVGELDFKIGERLLREAVREAKLPLTTASIVYGLRTSADQPRRSIFAPHVIKTIGRGAIFGVPYGGLKVGIFGLVRTHSHVPRPDPAHGRDTNPVEVLVKEAAAKQAVAALTAAGCDLIVGITQLSEQECADLAKQLPAIDVMIAGAQPRAGQQPRSGGRAVVVSTEYEGRSLGELVITWHGDQPVGLESFQHIKLGDAYKGTDAGGAAVQQALIDGYNAKLAELKLAPDVVRPTDGSYVGSESCQGCHTPTYEHWKHDASESLSHVNEEPTGPIVATAHGSRAFFDRHIGSKGMQWNPACMRCHSTGYGHAGGFVSVERTPDRVGVGCEACHGPRSRHVSWQRWKAGHRDSPQAPPEAPKGREIRAADCMGCHDGKNSPNFNFWKYSERIAHPK